MPDLRDTRRKLTFTLAALGIVDLAAIALLFSPLVGSARSRDLQLDQLGREIQQKTKQVEPLRGLDQKIVTARQQIADFYQNRLPAQDSVISEELGKLAAQSGVKIGQIKYSPKDLEPVGLRPVKIAADFSGDYLQLVRFINTLERDQLFFTVESVELAGEQSGVVKLQLKLETYLKTGV